MRISPVRLYLTGLAAAYTLLLAVGGAAASSGFSVSPSGSITATATAITFTAEEGSQVIAEVTLRGTIAATVPKTVGAHIGSITRCTIANARTSVEGATAEIDCSLDAPWRFTYSAFQGTLPEITGIAALLPLTALVRLRFGLIRVNECLYRGTLGTIGAGPIMNRWQIDPAKNTLGLFRVKEQNVRVCDLVHTAAALIIVTQQRLTLT